MNIITMEEQGEYENPINTNKTTKANEKMYLNLIKISAKFPVKAFNSVKQNLFVLDMLQNNFFTFKFY